MKKPNFVHYIPRVIPDMIRDPFPCHCEERSDVAISFPHHPLHEAKLREDKSSVQKPRYSEVFVHLKSIWILEQ
jgi:hypothetical protein